MTPEISIILPAYNEAKRIESTLTQIAAYFIRRGVRYEIIAAVDGNDGTREIVGALAAKDTAIRVIGKPERRGKGRGIREAVALATGATVGYMDADYKVAIEEFAVIQPWLAEYPVVIGSRALGDSVIEKKQPLYRRIGGRAFYYFMRAVVGLSGIRDTQCGFKFFRLDVAQRVFAAQRIDGYMFDVEVLALAQRFGYPIKEVPVRWRDDGDSRLQLLSGNLRNLIDIFKIAIRRS